MGVVRGLYLKNFEPIVQPREYLETFPKKKYYIVDMVYPLPLLSVDLVDADHLSANVTTAESVEVEVPDVYLDDGEISHMRMMPRDDFAVTWMAKPRARVYLTTKNKVWQVQTILDDPRTNPAVEHLQLNEIFQFGDTGFWMKVTSNLAVLTEARLIFFGYRMLVTEIKVVPEGIKPTKIPTEGWPGTVEE